MVTVNAYLKDLLIQIVASYKRISLLGDTSGDLLVLKKEISKITGVMSVLLNKIEFHRENDDNFKDITKTMRHFLDNYYFVREIDTMMPLYSEDHDRIKNIRYKIIESLNDKNLIEKIELLIQELA